MKTSDRSVAESIPLVGVNLILHGDSLDPSLVTSLLGTNPSRARVKGEKRRIPTDHEVVAKTGLWMLTAKSNSQSFSDQVSWLRRKLSSATQMPMNIPGVTHAKVSVFISLESNDRGGGEYLSMLSAVDLAWLSSLGIPMDFELTYISTKHPVKEPD